MPPIQHSLTNGYFSSEAVGRGLGRRYFDMRGVRVRSAFNGNADPAATLRAALESIAVPTGPAVVLGIFVHQGGHYSEMIRRHSTIYHIDSLRGVSRNGAHVFIVTLELFAAYVMRFAMGRRTTEGQVIGGIQSIFSVAVNLDAS